LRNKHAVNRSKIFSEFAFHLSLVKHLRPTTTALVQWPEKAFRKRLFSVWGSSCSSKKTEHAICGMHESYKLHPESFVTIPNGDDARNMPSLRDGGIDLALTSPLM